MSKMQIHAEVTGDGTNGTGKIRLRSAYNAQVVEFLRTLPAARWNKQEKVWSCDATPGAAWRILESGHDVIHNGELDLLAGNLTSGNSEITDPVNHTKTLFWTHQRKAFHFAKDKHAAMLSVCMGGGKSLIAVALLEYRKARTALIICPVAVRGVWRREFFKHCSQPHEVLVLDGTQSSKQKAEIARQFLERLSGSGVLAVVVVNYETARMPQFKQWAAFRPWDAVICDESHKLKSHSSKQSKTAHEIGKQATFRLCLTGTMMPSSPLDVFGQFRFLDAGIFGTYWTRFRSKYAVTGPLGDYHIVGYKNQNDLAEHVKLLTCEINADDAALDLPPVQHHTITCRLNAASRKQYTAMEQEMVAAVKSGVITADNALVKLLRLQQITSGFIRDEFDVDHPLGTEKQDALLDLIESIDPQQPVVVFCRFIQDLNSVRRVAEKLNRSYGEISGRQKDLTDHSTLPEGIQVFGVQIQAGGVGVDLSRSCYAVFMNHPWSLGDYDQALKRLDRPGQKHPVNYYHVVTENSIDETVIGALEKKRSVIDDVLIRLKEQKPE